MASRKNEKQAAKRSQVSTASRTGKASRVVPKNKPVIENPAFWIVIGAAILLFVAGMLFFQRGDGGTAAKIGAEISVSEALAKREAGAFILDVRQPEEWQEYHIPDSTLIPLGDLESRLSEVPKDQEIVVVCRSGNRSQQGRDILLNAGFAPVSSMAGGLKEWQSAGYPTTTGN